jgi:hypothetical protein
VRGGAGHEPEAELEPIPLTDPVAASEAPDEALDGAVVWVDEMPGSGMIDPTEAGLAEIEQITARERDAAPREPRPRSRTKKPGGKGAATVTVAPDVDVDEATTPRQDLADWVRRWRNVLLFVGVTLLIVATIALRQWRQYRQDLPQIAALGRVEGLAALDEGEFDKAYQLLSRARHAARGRPRFTRGPLKPRSSCGSSPIVWKRSSTPPAAPTPRSGRCGSPRSTRGARSSSTPM